MYTCLTPACKQHDAHRYGSQLSIGLRRRQHAGGLPSDPVLRAAGDLGPRRSKRSSGWRCTTACVCKFAHAVGRAKHAVDSGSRPGRLLDAPDGRLRFNKRQP